MSQSAETLLRVDVSPRGAASTTRQLADQLVARVGVNKSIINRDLSEAIPFVDAAWVDASNTEPEDRNEEQLAALAASDALVAELQAADTVVISTPMYNFSIPAVLKAWIDQVARARLTFKYTENGPVGLLTGKKVYIVIGTGGTAIGSDIDYASGYLKHVLAFLGINDVTIIDAGQQMVKGDAAIEAANDSIAALAV